LIPTKNTALHLGDFSKISEKKANTIFNDIEKNYQRMAICYMNNKVGHGVFATEEIPVGSYVAFYSGEISYADEEITLADDDINRSMYYIQADITYKDKEKNLQGLIDGNIDAKYFGNISRFFQHLPSQKKIDDHKLTNIHNYTFINEQISEKIAIENLNVTPYTFKGRPLLLFMASRTIMQGDIMGFDYGKPYWLGCDITPSLFYRNGSLVNSDLYTMKKIAITLKIGKFDFKFTTERDLLLKLEDENEEEDENELLEEIDPGFGINIKETLAEPVTKLPHVLFFTLNCSSQLRFFRMQKEVAVERLNEFTRHFNLSTWEFDADNNRALLHLEKNEENKKLISYIADHLKEYDMDVKMNMPNDNDLLVLSVLDPKAIQLINLKPLQKMNLLNLY
jgi:hypothetical protein